ncbi:hypothetical protein FPL06_03615 [Xanthomonas citri pv. glycines]|nr:hypothetical protein BHE84_24825 [Xanthomonas citri pv. glycines str. 8ra]KAB0538534.1 hypothetical protein F7R02_04600 [Xanthomonas cissicola]PNV27524.1 hypothetical protein xavtCFBP7764_17250 [Xanthomonas citri]QDR47100.1 hypothetical protein FPK90_22660 [Xanthomonas citri pv. glycines]QDS09085.1 hypothetical protein FPL00_21475 [Xanthomonas citri pv. glycines]
MGFYSCFRRRAYKTATAAQQINLEESPLSQGARQRRGVWKLMKQGPRFATRTVEAKRECA